VARGALARHVVRTMGQRDHSDLTEETVGDQNAAGATVWIATPSGPRRRSASHGARLPFRWRLVSAPSARPRVAPGPARAAPVSSAAQADAVAHELPIAAPRTTLTMWRCARNVRLRARLGGSSPSS